MQKAQKAAGKKREIYQPLFLNMSNNTERPMNGNSLDIFLVSRVIIRIQLNILINVRINNVWIINHRKAAAVFEGQLLKNLLLERNISRLHISIILLFQF